MIVQTRTFRVFVSSTFSDLRAERDALQDRVFPRLRALCTERGAQFQAIDLRWGISEEASLDQQTMNICLGEIQRCQNRSPRPNFLVLLGDRYGWRPPPPQIPAKTFESILDRTVTDDKTLLQTWYSRDDNAVPPEYCLRPREKGEVGGEPESWGHIEGRLQSILAAAVGRLGLDSQESLPFVASATHQEVASGALSVEDAHEHVCCFFRSIQGLPPDRRAAEYLDLFEDGSHDSGAQDSLKRLKDELRSRLPNNVFEYAAEWHGEGVTQDHIEPLCRDVYEQLSRLIIEETQGSEDRDTLQFEIDSHEAFGREHTRFFVGRNDPLRLISEYLKGAGRHPMLVVGASGSGKTSLMAEAARRAERDHTGAEVVKRFLGSTPDSSVTQKLLEGLCRQIDRKLAGEESSIPADSRDLFEAFEKRLTFATQERPIILFIDALDQLTDNKDGRGFSWIRANLPAHVYLVISTIPGRPQEILGPRLPEKNVIHLAPMPGTDAKVLLDQWLKSARRTLRDDQRRDLLVRFQNCPSPLFLRLAFEEARRWRSYPEAVPESRLLPDHQENVEGVLRRLFGRLSSEAHHGEILVSRTLAYLAAGKNGLSEEELLDVLAGDVEVLTWFLRSTYHTPDYLLRHAEGYLGSDPKALVGFPSNSSIDRELAQAWLERVRRDPDKTRLNGFLSTLLTNGVRLPLPVVLWSRLFFDLEPYLSPRSADGAVTYRFFHRQVQEVVTEDYLDEVRKESIHRTLADYFKSQALEITHEDGVSPNRRKLSELPYQEACSGSWDDLSSTMRHLPFLQTKLKASGPQPLIDDFEEAFRLGYPGRTLPWIQKALMLSANVLAEDPLQLSGHLVGRLMARPEEEIQSLLGQARAWKEIEWLCPLTPNLSDLDEPLLRTMDGHGQAVTAVASHPDGHRVLSASSDQTIRFWDLHTGEQLALSQVSPTRTTALAFLPSGREFVAGSEDGSLTLWDIETMRESRRFEGHEEAVQSIAVLPDQTRFISGSSDGTLGLWDVVAGSPVRTFRGHVGGVNAVAVFSGGTRAISASTDGTLRVWDLEAGSTVRVLEGHTGAVNAIVIYPDGHHALTGQLNRGKHVSRNLRLWDLKTGEEVSNLPCRTWDVNALGLTEDGNEALAGLSDSTIKILDLEKGKILRSLEGHGAEVKSLAIGPGQNRVVSGSSDGTLKVWNLDHLPTSPLVSPDLSLPEDQRRIQERRYLNSPVGKGTHALSTAAVSIFPNRRRAASVTHVGTAGPEGENGVSRLAVWDLATGMRVSSLELGLGLINSLEIFPDGERAVVSSGGNRFQMLNLRSGECSEGPAGHSGPLTHLTLFGAGRYAASASDDGTVRIWHFDPRIPSGILENHIVLEGHRAKVNHVSVFPDGKRLVSASEDRALIIWDLKTMRPLRKLEGHAGAVTVSAVLGGGQKVLSACRDGMISIWEARTGKTLRTIEGHVGEVRGLAEVGPDGSFVSASADRNLKVWESVDGRLRSRFQGEGRFNCCAAERTGDTLVAGDDSGRVHILRLIESRTST